jgi:hypothetical protein
MAAFAAQQVSRSAVLQPVLQKDQQGLLLLLPARRGPVLMMQLQGQTDQALPLLLLLQVVVRAVQRGQLAQLLAQQLLLVLLELAHHPGLSS